MNSPFDSSRTICLRCRGFDSATFLLTTFSGGSSKNSELNGMVERKQSLLGQFWKQLLKENLSTLRQRSKWQNSIDVLKQNDVVWLSEPITPRGIWPLDVIDEVLPSKDGIPRSFRVRT